MELAPQSYGSYLALLRHEYDLAPLFRKRSVPVDVIMRLDGKVVLISTIEYQAGAERPYIVRRWHWPIPETPGFGHLETWLIGTGGILL